MEGDWTPGMTVLVIGVIAISLLVAWHIHEPVMNADNYCRQYAHDINWQRGVGGSSKDTDTIPDPVLAFVMCGCHEEEFSKDPWAFSLKVTVCEPRWLR